MGLTHFVPWCVHSHFLAFAPSPTTYIPCFTPSCPCPGLGPRLPGPVLGAPTDPQQAWKGPPPSPSPSRLRSSSSYLLATEMGDGPAALLVLQVHP